MQNINKIAAKLGGKVAGEATEAIRCGDYHKSVELVLGYYDKTYEFGLGKREENRVFRLKVENPVSGTALADQILDFTVKNILSWNLSN